MTAPSPALMQEITACEIAVWQALVDGDVNADASALCDDFLGVYPDGFAGKADHVGQLDHGPTVAWYQLQETHLRQISDDVVLLSYAVRFQRPESSGPEEMLVSSIWKRRKNGWVNIFSQDTVKDPS